MHNYRSMTDHQAEKALLPFSVEEAIKKDEKTTTEASVTVSFLFRCSISNIFTTYPCDCKKVSGSHFQILTPAAGEQFYEAI